MSRLLKSLRFVSLSCYDPRHLRRNHQVQKKGIDFSEACDALDWFNTHLVHPSSTSN